MIEWWAGLSPGFRIGVAIAVLLFSGVMFFVSWKFFAVSLALGIALFIFAFPSGPEKKGYHDF